MPSRHRRSGFRKSRSLRASRSVWLRLQGYPRKTATWLVRKFIQRETPGGRPRASRCRSRLQSVGKAGASNKHPKHLRFFRRRANGSGGRDDFLRAQKRNARRNSTRRTRPRKPFRLRIAAIPGLGDRGTPPAGDGPASGLSLNGD